MTRKHKDLKTAIDKLGLTELDYLYAWFNALKHHSNQIKQDIKRKR